MSDNPGCFQPGNQLWKLRKKWEGSPKVFKSPEELFAKCITYFEWADANPVTKQIIHQGQVTGYEEHSRPYTLDGLCTTLGISISAWGRYRKDETHKDFHEVCLYVDQIIREQKFSGAAVGVFNASLIGNEIGIKSHTQAEITENKNVTVIERRIVRPDAKPDATDD